MASIHRITVRKQYQRVSREGLRRPTQHVVLQWLPLPDETHLRWGWTVSRHVGNAVKRNRVKRKIRAVLSGLDVEARGGWMVVVAREAAYQATSDDIARDIAYGVRKLWEGGHVARRR